MSKEPSLSEVREEIQELKEAVQTLAKTFTPELAEKLKVIVEAYDSVLFGKKFLAGLATIIGSITAIGAGVWWLIDSIRHHN